MIWSGKGGMARSLGWFWKIEMITSRPAEAREKIGNTAAPAMVLPALNERTMIQSDMVWCELNSKMPKCFDMKGFDNA